MTELVASLYKMVSSVAAEIITLREKVKQQDDEIRGLKVRIRMLKELSS